MRLVVVHRDDARIHEPAQRNRDVGTDGQRPGQRNTIDVLRLHARDAEALADRFGGQAARVCVAREFLLLHGC